MANYERDIGCKPLSRSEAYLDTLKSQMPEMDKLFTALDEGYTPNFLDIMRAISEMVAFYTDHDQIPLARKASEKKMSGKKCLFCY